MYSFQGQGYMKKLWIFMANSQNEQDIPLNSQNLAIFSFGYKVYSSIAIKFRSVNT